MWREDMAREGRAFHPLNVIMMTAAQANSPNARIAAITASAAPPSFQGSRSVGGLIEFANEPIKRSTGSSYSTFEYDIGDEDDCGECCQIRGKKRRLSSEQVRTLEKTFEMADKVEPEKKVQLARALGLQPRQIAVWFQNRRARWKTKQLEKDFDVLKHDYDALKADYDSLLEQNKSLQAKVQRLRSIKLQNQLDHEFECTQEEEPRANINTRVIKDHEGASSVGSEASTVWNTDSPGTINSHTPSPLPRGDSTGLKVSDRLPHIESNFNPKLKEYVIPDGSCCDLLYNNLEDEQGALWWDCWPQSLEQIPLRI